MPDVAANLVVLKGLIQSGDTASVLNQAEADALYDAAGAAAAAYASAASDLSDHVAATDPHTGYQKESEKSAAGGYASLDGATKVPIAELPTGTASTDVCAGDDSRLSDARTPTSHAASHKSGGSDPIALDELAAPTDVTTLNASTSAHGLLKKLSNVSTEFMNGQGNWATPSGTPSAHATSHKSGGTDAIKLDELAAPTDVTNLNASTSAHGLLPKLTNVLANFLRADGAWASPVWSVADQVSTVSGIKSFSAYRNTTYAVPAGGWSKINIDTERWDVGSIFDHTTNHRATPTPAGVFKFFAHFYADNPVSNTLYGIAIYKNGSLSGGILGSLEQITATITTKAFFAVGLAQANGSTDTFDLYVYNGHATNTLNLIGGVNNGRFDGSWASPSS